MKNVLAGAIVLMAFLCISLTSMAQCSEWADYDASPSSTSSGGVYDDAGNLYMTYFLFDSLIIDHGTFTLSPPYNAGVVVAKYDPQGNPLWAEQLNTEEFNLGGVRLAARGNRVFLSGAAYQSFSAGGFTINVNDRSPFVVTMDSAGQILNLVAFSSDRDSWLSDMEIDNSGNLVTVGNFRLTLTIGNTTLSKPQSTTGIQWSFIAKLDPSGNPMWAYQSTSSGIGYLNSSEVEIGPGNEIFIGGRLAAEANYAGLSLVNDPNEFEAAPFLMKLDSNGTGIWADYGRGTGFTNAHVTALGLHSSGDIYMATSMATADTIFWGGNGFARVDGNVLLSKHDANGNLSFTHHYTTTNSYTSLTSSPRGLEEGPSGKMWVGGNIEDSTTISGTLLPVGPSSEYNVLLYSLDQNDQVGDLKHFAGHPYSILNRLSISPNGRKAISGTFKGSNINFGSLSFNASGTNGKGFVFVDCDFVVTAEETTAESMDFQLYPNPVLDQLHLDVDLRKPGQSLLVEVYDLYGREMMAATHQAAGSHVQADLQVGELPNGTYLLRVSNERGHSMSRRFVKQD